MTNTLTIRVRKFYTQVQFRYSAPIAEALRDAGAEIPGGHARALLALMTGYDTLYWSKPADPAERAQFLEFARPMSVRRAIAHGHAKVRLVKRGQTKRKVESFNDEGLRQIHAIDSASIERRVADLGADGLIRVTVCRRQIGPVSGRRCSTSTATSTLLILISAGGSVDVICPHAVTTPAPIMRRPEIATSGKGNPERSMAIAKVTADKRPDWLSYQALLDTDTHSVPEVLRRTNPINLRPSEIPVERYISRDFFDLEVERLWKRVWQMACREEDIPNVGDNIVYDIAGMSFPWLCGQRQIPSKPSTMPAFHRGRLLRESGSFRATEFRCPFHGFAWNIDGALEHVPCQWDFPQIRPSEWCLPEAKLWTWAASFLSTPIKKPNLSTISSDRS